MPDFKLPSPSQTLELTHNGTLAKHFRITLSWLGEKVGTGFLDSIFGKNDPVDLDLSCILLDRTGGLLETVWFGNMRSRAESIQHHGDRMAKSTDDDDASPDEPADPERIDIYFDKISPQINTLWFVVSSFSGQPLNKVADVNFRVLDMVKRTEVAHFTLDTGLNKHTGTIVACLHRQSLTLEDWQLSYYNTPINAKTPIDLAAKLAAWSVGNLHSINNTNLS